MVAFSGCEEACGLRSLIDMTVSRSVKDDYGGSLPSYTSQHTIVQLG